MADFQNGKLHPLILGLAALIFMFQIFQVMRAGGASLTSPSLPDIAGQEVTIKTKDGIFTINPQELLAKVLPAKKALPATWQGIPYQLVDKKIIDLEKLKEYSLRYGQPLTADDLKIFEKNYNGNIEVTPNNSTLIYNILWTIGFMQKGPILDYELDKYGWKTVRNLAGYYFSFANLGAGSTLAQAGYNSEWLIRFTTEQKDLIMKVAGKSAVPSCGNSLWLPDCSCSFAIVALIELMASQGFGEQEIYQAMKDIYPYRYPKLYVQYAMLYQLTKKQNWDEINAEELVSFQFSSAQGIGRMNNVLANILGQTTLQEEKH